MRNIKVMKSYDILFPFKLSYTEYKTLVETDKMIVVPSTVNPMLVVTTSCSSVVPGRKKQEE